MGGRHITFEIKAVNHKYFEFSARITRGYLFLEDKLKSHIQAQVSRGKVDVFVQVDTLEEADVQVQVNHPLAAGYANAFRELKAQYALDGDVSLELLAAHNDIFSVHRAPENEEEIFEAVKQVARPAIVSFIQMREAEGLRLQEDILQRAGKILSHVEDIEKISPKTVSDYRARLYEKIAEVLETKSVDEQRVLTEVAIFADKIAVDEETVRLRSHFAQLQEMAGTNEPIGRKMDFLVQEMNREANTIGSKSMNSDIAYKIVAIKAEIEKIREQVQNIE